MMDKLYQLKDRLKKELEGYAEKTSLNASDLDITMKLAGAVKNLCKIEKMMDEDDGYSTRMVYGRDPMNRDVEPGRDMSYARGRMNAPRDSRGRYSGESGYSRHSDPAGDLRRLMEHAPDAETRREMERIARMMENE
jgi:hypothetical protein